MKFWCGTAFMDTREAPQVARLLDEAGYDGMLVSDHLVYPRQLSSPYPGTPDGRPFWPPETAWPDAWVLIGAMAAVTERLQFANNVYVAPARPLVEVAKQVATAAVVADGRVALGLSAGWMREEFELLGQDFSNRGRRLDEMIPALRALWAGGWVSWEGEHYQVPEAARWAERLDGYRTEYGRDAEPFEIIVALLDQPSPDLYARAEELGITGTMISPWAQVESIHAGDHADLKHPAERYRAPIEKFAEKILARCR